MKHFINRELSWLDFNRRVLGEAADPAVPLLERANFLSITASNADEFCMVRLGKLLNRVKNKDESADPAGLNAREQVAAIRARLVAFERAQGELYENDLLPALSRAGFELVKPDKLSRDQKVWLRQYFEKQILPILTPRVPDPAFPFPHLQGKALNIACPITNRKTGKRVLCVVSLPPALPRVVDLPTDNHEHRGVLLEDVLLDNIARMFPGASKAAAAVFRLTRNTDYVLNLGSTDYILEAMEKILKRRPYGKVVRLEIQRGAHEETVKLLTRRLSAPPEAVIAGLPALDFTFLSKALKPFDAAPGLRYPPFEARVAERLQQRESIFRTIRGGDLVFHHPYDSYGPIVRFINEAADDPKVLAIKQTLYRVSGNSPFVAALVRAAQQGKQVTVLVEVRARFDEANNIAWSHALEKAGVHVLYGFPKWKTHSKIALVVRREGSGIRRYLHLGTGNYNDATARGYTDLSLLTCNEVFAQDASAFFNLLAGYPESLPSEKLVASPFSLRAMLEEKIDREAANAAAGLPARIVAKMR